MAVIKIQTGLRLDETTYGKLRTLADKESRSLNNLVEYVLKTYLLNYEQKFGEVPVHQED